MKLRNAVAVNRENDLKNWPLIRKDFISMACLHNVIWCNGPDGYGKKCFNCQKDASSRSIPTAPMPIITALPRLVTPAPAGASTQTAVKGVTVYRGDERDKEKLGAAGFEAWVQLTLEEAREFVRVSVGLIEWEKSGLYGKYIKTGLLNISQGLLNKNRTPADLLEWRIRTGSGNRKVCLVSTDTANTCGGYANGYIYKIYLEGLQEREWAKAVPGMKAKAPLWPSLLLDAETLDEATVIAIKSPKVMTLTEVAFLTPISTDKIVEVNYVGK